MPSVCWACLSRRGERVLNHMTRKCRHVTMQCLPALNFEGLHNDAEACETFPYLLTLRRCYTTCSTGHALCTSQVVHHQQPQNE